MKIFFKYPHNFIGSQLKYTHLELICENMKICPLTCASVLNLYKIKFKYFNNLKIVWTDFLQSDRMKYFFNTNKRSKVIALVKCFVHLCWPYANYMKSHCVHPIVFINCYVSRMSTAFVLFCRLVFDFSDLCILKQLYMYV